MLCSSAGCCYFIYKSLLDYLSFDVITNIDIAYEQPAEFPAVSICSRDSYNFTNLSEIIRCQFNYDSDCLTNREKYFESFDDPHYNLCYRFNSRNVSLNATYSGKANGLHLDIHLDQQIDFSKLVVYIHNKSMNPYGLYNKG